MTKKSERDRKILRRMALVIFAVLFLNEDGGCSFSTLKASLATHSGPNLNYAYLALFILATLMLIFTSGTIFRRIKAATLFQMR